VLARTALDGSVGQREQLAAWETALAGSGLPVAGLDATPPRLRFALAAPLTAAIPGEAELADVWLTERVQGWRVRDSLRSSLPEGYGLVDAYDIWLGAPALPGQVVASVYRATLRAAQSDATALRHAADEMLAASSLPRDRPKGQETVRYDLRPFIERLEISGSLTEGGAAAPVARMTLRHDPERGIGRPEEVLAELGDRLGSPLRPTSLVRERLVLAPPPVSTPPRAASGPARNNRGRSTPRPSASKT
jgi:hypothetical protein